ncbi:hypothetical protein, partial [Helicobacter sp. 12S02634-8]|uniref:hypothetical protein n=1 Tax=Helicobacter sp. 12S02634-8 TaxID=1476199 RepID=UPI00117A1938
MLASQAYADDTNKPTRTHDNFQGEVVSVNGSTGMPTDSTKYCDTSGSSKCVSVVVNIPWGNTWVHPNLAQHYVLTPKSADAGTSDTYTIYREANDASGNSIFKNPINNFQVQINKAILKAHDKAQTTVTNGSWARFTIKDGMFQGDINLAAGGGYGGTTWISAEGSYQGTDSPDLKGYALVGDIKDLSTKLNATFKNDANFKGTVRVGNNAYGVATGTTMTFTKSSMTGDITQQGLFDRAYNLDISQNYTFDGNSSSKGYALKGYDGKLAEVNYFYGPLTMTFKGGAKGYINLYQDSDTWDAGNSDWTDSKYQSVGIINVEGSNTLLEGKMEMAGGHSLTLNVKDNATAKVEFKTSHSAYQPGARDAYVNISNGGTLEGSISSTDRTHTQVNLDNGTIIGNVQTNGRGTYNESIKTKSVLPNDSLTAIASTIKGNITGDQKAAITLINSDVGDIDESHTASTLTFATKRPTTDSSK